MNKPFDLYVYKLMVFRFIFWPVVDGNQDNCDVGEKRINLT